jgi:F1F0 ATPase subunit 2
MIEIAAPLLAWLAGAVLGGIFFGGLWWTVCKGLSSKRPALWFVASLLLRMSIVLAGIYFVAHGRWQRLLLCLFGFVMARLVVTWLTRDRRPQPPRVASHAS